MNTDKHLLDVRRLILELDLSTVAKNMISKQGWLKSEVNACSILYKNYLFLRYKYPDEDLPPSQDIDEFWHNHILDTKKYREDCEKIFGCYLDHNPNLDIDSTTSMADLNHPFATTQRLHAKEFGYSITGVRYTKFSHLIRRILGDD